MALQLEHLQSRLYQGVRGRAPLVNLLCIDLVPENILECLKNYAISTIFKYEQIFPQDDFHYLLHLQIDGAINTVGED